MRREHETRRDANLAGDLEACPKPARPLDLDRPRLDSRRDVDRGDHHPDEGLPLGRGDPRMAPQRREIGDERPEVGQYRRVGRNGRDEGMETVMGLEIVEVLESLFELVGHALLKARVA